MEGCWGRKGCASPRAFPGPDWGRAMFVKMLSPPPPGRRPPPQAFSVTVGWLERGFARPRFNRGTALQNRRAR